jgi:hypothetical protein
MGQVKYKMEKIINKKSGEVINGNLDKFMKSRVVNKTMPAMEVKDE